MTTDRARTLTLTFLCSLAGVSLLSAEDFGPTRAAWWLTQDDVVPISDLLNTAGPGKPVKFVDRVGGFHMSSEGRALLITGEFPEANIWRFDLTTFDDQFDMSRTYTVWGHCAYPNPDSIWTRRFAKLLADPEKALTHTGPWETHNSKWKVPTARIGLDGQHVYTSWFDLPSLADQAAGRVYASFALDIGTPGKHTIRVSLEDFPHHTRWRLPSRRKTKPEIEYSINPLRPHHIDSIAIGIDERVRMIPDIALRPELKGKHPRLENARPVKKENLGIKDVERMLIHVDTERGKLWEYSDDAESMASENDMDSGKHAVGCGREYDAHVNHLSPEARKEWDRIYHHRFNQYYNFFVLQRNYHPTGYAQNHSSCTIIGLLYAGMAWDRPEGLKWLRWGIMTCRKRVELLGKDGGVEFMNESRSYGLRYFQAPMAFIKYSTGLDITKDEPFFQNEWRYALHNTNRFPIDPDRKPEHLRFVRKKGKKKSANPNVPIPAGITAEITPTDWHFDDVDQVYMRSDWGDDAWRARLWAGTVFGKSAKIAKRYNWAHCRVNHGSFVLSKGLDNIVLETGATRTYRKGAGNNNCILINDTDQWGGGQVWHPKLEPEQISTVEFFADGSLMAATRADLTNAYPPEARAKAVSRCLIRLKPDHFLVFDRIETDGPGKAEWRFHTPFPEPMEPASRYTAFGYKRLPRPRGSKGGTYEEHFVKKEEVSCEIAFLRPDVKATIAMTDTYYRYGLFALPQRHLKITQNAEKPQVLLTAFATKLLLREEKSAYVGKSGPVTWTVLVGGGSSNGLESDAHLAIAAHDTEKGMTEVLRFGGKRLSFKGVSIGGRSPDVFGVMDEGKLKQSTETLKR
ncbi:MAG: heparinase II/III family protein [Planctomycetota bacterium]|nr:heparinase II/III family protein [Planctomycetota bacterium]MDP7129043.1 heparinase II/III family protein [Planctomycetota bacterium]MDP7250280.1 heparinase II/III family protein [Planctomycetota bacterium]